MAWNGSDQTQPKSGKYRKAGGRTAAPSSPLRGLLAALIVVAGAAAVWWFFLRPAPPPAAAPSGEGKAGAIAEQKPEIVTNVPAAKPAPAPEKPKELPPQKVGEVRNGYVLLPSGRLHRRLGVITNNMNSAHNKLAYEIFDHSCENEIACLLELPPGEGLVGNPVYNGRFKAEFLKSLETPIVINEEDSDYVKRLKRDVRETKVELKARLDAGEDIEEIMTNARKESQQLAIYKMQLEQQMDEVISQSAETSEDVEDCIKAMNAMLEAKGIAPVEVGPIAKRKIRNMMREKGIPQK